MPADARAPRTPKDVESSSGAPDVEPSVDRSKIARAGRCQRLFNSQKRSVWVLLALLGVALMVVLALEVHAARLHGATSLSEVAFLVHSSLIQPLSSADDRPLLPLANGAWSHHGGPSPSRIDSDDVLDYVRGWQPPSLGARSIPRVVHQSWRSSHVPAKLSRYCRSWQEKQPQWRYVLHTDVANARLVMSRYSWLAPLYRQLSAIQRADVSRLLYMHAYGGVYADLDVELLAPLASWLEAECARHGATLLLGQEPLAHSVLLESMPRQTCNAVLASAPGHPFWLWVLRLVSKRAYGWDDPVGSTGPRVLEEAVVSWQAAHANGSAAVVVAPPETFYPTWDPMQARAR